VAGGGPVVEALGAGPAPGWPPVHPHDAVPGGVGFSERCHDQHPRLLSAAAGIVDGCDCAAGCPSCVGPSPAGVDARAATRRLLRLALDEVSAAASGQGQAGASAPPTAPPPWRRRATAWPASVPCPPGPCPRLLRSAGPRRRRPRRCGPR